VRDHRPVRRHAGAGGDEDVARGRVLAQDEAAEWADRLDALAGFHCI
jgi:hypothetical protein